MTNEQIVRELANRGISSGEVNVTMRVRDGKLNYEQHRETVDMVEAEIARVVEDDEAGIL